MAIHGLSALMGPTYSPGGGIDKPVEYFDDFVTGGYHATEAAKFGTAADDGHWHIGTQTATGTPTVAISDNEPGGVVAITNGTADNDYMSMQLNGESFQIAKDKDLYYEVRMKLSDADTSDWFLGLAITDTEVLGGVTDSIGFRYSDGTADIHYVTEKNSTETTADTTKDLSDDTFAVLSFYVKSNESVTFYVDGAQVAKVTTNLPNDEAVTPTIALRNKGATAMVMEIDYIYVAQTR